jgi:hypothetical protein
MFPVGDRILGFLEGFRCPSTTDFDALLLVWSSLERLPYVSYVCERYRGTLAEWWIGCEAISLFAGFQCLHQRQACNRVYSLTLKQAPQY